MSNKLHEIKKSMKIFVSFLWVNGEAHFYLLLELFMFQRYTLYTVSKFKLARFHCLSVKIITNLSQWDNVVNRWKFVLICFSDSLLTDLNLESKYIAENIQFKLSSSMQEETLLHIIVRNFFWLNHKSYLIL